MNIGDDAFWEVSIYKSNSNSERKGTDGEWLWMLFEHEYKFAWKLHQKCLVGNKMLMIINISDSRLMMLWIKGLSQGVKALSALTWHLLRHGPSFSVE